MADTNAPTDPAALVLPDELRAAADHLEETGLEFWAGQVRNALRSLAELREQREGEVERQRLAHEIDLIQGLKWLIKDRATADDCYEALDRSQLKRQQRLAALLPSLEELVRSTASPAPGKEDQALTNNRPKRA